MNDYFRVVKRRNGFVIVDVNGEPIQPEQAKQLATQVAQTAGAKEYVYFAKRDDSDKVKIGRSTNLDRRQTDLGGVTFIHTIECDLYGECGASRLEAAFHRFFADERVEDEPGREWFYVGTYDLDMIQRHCKTVQGAQGFIKEYEPVLKEVLDGWDSDQQGFLHAMTESVSICINHKAKSGVYINAVLVMMQRCYNSLKREKNEFGEGYVLALLNFVEIDVELKSRIRKGEF